MAGTPVATLYNIETAKVVIPIPGFETAFLPTEIKDTPVTIRVPGSTETRTGKVRHTIGVLDEATRMTQILIEIPDPFAISLDASALNFGNYIEATFPGRVLPNIFTLPQDLVTANSVWLLGDGNQLTKAEVNVLRQEGDYFLINSGLSESDFVVTTPPEYPSEGMQVRTLETAQQDTDPDTNLGVKRDAEKEEGSDSE
jgi:hypothetical protein